MSVCFEEKEEKKCLFLLYLKMNCINFNSLPFVKTDFHEFGYEIYKE